MARIRLDLQTVGEGQLVRPDGSVARFPVLRPYVHARIVGTVVGFDAVIDTGAPLSIFPAVFGSQYSHAVRFYPGYDKVPAANLPTASAGGRVYRCKPGTVRVSLLDASGELPPLDVTGYFIVERVSPPPNPADPKDADRDLKTPLLGLWEGVLEGRYFVLSPHADATRREAWLTDERPVAPLVLARAVL